MATTANNVNWTDHSHTLIVGPDAVNKLSRVREALDGCNAGELSEHACLIVIGGIVFSQQEIQEKAEKRHGKLHCYHDELEWIVAESPEDASKIQANYIGEEASSPDQFKKVLLDEELMIHSKADEEFGNGYMTKTVKEWIDRNGRGLLCSSEW